jgi:hypothetical protein
LNYDPFNPRPVPASPIKDKSVPIRALGASLTQYVSFSVVVVLYAIVLAGCPKTDAMEGPQVPAIAVASGYTTLTFDAKLTPVDAHSYSKPGRHGDWFYYNFFGLQVTPQSVKSNDDGTITLLGGALNSKGQFVPHNGQIATAVLANTTDKFIGKAFGGGGYFEAELKFDFLDPETKLSKNWQANLWPAFWSMAIEHLASLPAQHWSGHTGDYVHFSEVDFMEYGIAKAEPNNFEMYLGSIVDWYGVWNSTCPTPSNQLCSVQNPYRDKMRILPGLDFSSYHAYGFLWIPATNTSIGHGYWYFDGAQIGAGITWPKFDPQVVNPPHQGAAFSILDRDKLVLILGTGLDVPMTVRSVRVWQANEQSNVVR